MIAVVNIFWGFDHGEQFMGSGGGVKAMAKAIVVQKDECSKGHQFVEAKSY